MGAAALQSFTRADLAALPAPSAGATAVLAAAEIDLFGVFAAHFFGRIADDGSFALVTSADVGSSSQLPLAINGLTIALPFELSGRLRLEGQVNHTRRFAAIHAQGRGRWDVLPGVLHVAAGVKKPIDLRVESTGRFRLSGDGVIDLFDGALRMTGALSASESHLSVSGALDLTLGGDATAPVVALHAGGALHIGPGSKWGFDGEGTLKLFNLTLAEASVRLSDREVSVHAAVERRRWRIGSLQFDTHVSGELDGRVLFTEQQPLRPVARPDRGHQQCRGRWRTDPCGRRYRRSCAFAAAARWRPLARRSSDRWRWTRTAARCG